MSSYSEFINEFQQNLPKFLQNKHKNFYKDIIFLIENGLKEEEGVEFRGYFGLKFIKNEKRNTFKFKDFYTKNSSNNL